MADRLIFVGNGFRAVSPDDQVISITIRSTFPTIANAGVQLFRDNGNNTISQIGSGQLIDTSVNTPEGDTAVFSFPGTGKYAVAFQGNATSVDGSPVTVEFEIRSASGALLEDFQGPRSLPGPVVPIAGTGFVITSDLGEVA